MMSQVAPVDLELCMIVHMNELMHKCVLHVFLAKESALAHNDGAGIRVETTCTGVVAGHAEGGVLRHGSPGEIEMLEHEDNRRA